MTMRKSPIAATLLLLAGAGSGALAQEQVGSAHGAPITRPAPAANPGNGGNGNNHGGPGQGNGGNAGNGGHHGGSGNGGWHGGPGAGPGRPSGPGYGGPGYSPGRARGYVDFDRRYNHNHYYPSRGFVYASLPYGAYSVGYGGGNYFFHGGVWFRPYGARYVVVTPPPGIYLPMLPPDYATIWVGGAPYYYADGVYYTASPGQGYVVVAPPPGADTVQATPPPAPTPPAPDPILYPRNNQSAAQTEADRRDCNSWATTQPQAMADAKVFQRAVEACMDGRGYTVR